MSKNLNTNIFRYLLVITLLCIVNTGQGQNAPSSETNVGTQQNLLQVHSPHKAAMYSALVPGLGQIYNKKYWKLPIIYGLTGVMIYAFDFNNDQYNKYNNAYYDMKSGKITKFEGHTSYQTLDRLREGYRRNRDLNVIVMAFVYLLNVVDATVDAHLFDYEISEDLSLNIQPAINKTFDNQNSVGISCSIAF